MSYRKHPTKNKGLTTPRFWYIGHYPDGKKGGLVNTLFEGTEAEARIVDVELRKSRKGMTITVNPQFNTVLPDFMDHYKIERLPRTVETTLLHLNHLKKLFGPVPLSSATNLVEQYKRQRLSAGVKPITINKELNALSVLLKWAAKKQYIAEPPAVEYFPKKMTVSPLPILPLAEDFEKIVNEVNPRVRGIIMLEFYAGLRRNEAHYIKAEEVLLDRKLLILKGKGGRQRIVPIHKQEVLDELRGRIEKVKTGYLYINPVTKRPYRRIDEALKNAARRVGVDIRVYHHLLRHGFATTALEDGVDLLTVSKTLGHSTVKTTEIYEHLAASHIIKQMEKFRK